MIKGFRDFIMRGNIVDLAIAVAIGGAFIALVGAFTDYFINPILASLGGSNAIGLGFFIVDGNPATYVNIGAMIGAIITFLITAAAIYFIVVVPMNKLNERRAAGTEEAPAEPTDVELLGEIRDLLRSQNRS